MPINRQYHVQDIIKMTPEQVRELPEGGLWLTFDDGSVTKAKTYKTEFCSHYWRFASKHGASITQDMSMCRTIDGEYTEELFTAGTQAKYGQMAFWEAFYSGQLDPDRFWNMSEEMYKTTNILYNGVVSYDMRYMSTFSLEDSMQVLMHPKIVATKKRYYDGEILIDECHDICYNIVKNDTEYFKDNDIHLCVRCGLLSITQVKQLIGPRGSIPDINSEAFPFAIDSGYYERLNYAYDSTIESKTSSIALYMQGGPLEDSEYNNRLNGMSAGYIRGVHYGDCGTKNTVSWHVTTKAHLKGIVGKNLVIKGKLQRCTGKEEHLIGTRVQFRSPTVCEHQERGIVCSTCIGQNAFLVPPKGSPGHILIIDPLGQISQTILSTKHVLSNVIALVLKIKGNAVKYMENHPDNHFMIRLKSDFDVNSVKLRIPQEQVMYLSDLDFVDDLAKVNITSISDVENVTFARYNGAGQCSTLTVDTTVSGVGACLTKDFLNHVSNTGYEIKGEYVEFDLEGWDLSVPILVTKRVSQDVTETLRQFKDFIQPKIDRTGFNHTPITRCDSVDEAIAELFNVLSSRITVNVAQVEMFIAPLMARTFDYNLPNGNEPYRFITLKDCLTKRSSLISLGYQGQTSYLFNPATYLKEESEVPVHPMDALLCDGNPNVN